MPRCIASKGSDGRIPAGALTRTTVMTHAPASSRRNGRENSLAAIEQGIRTFEKFDLIRHTILHSCSPVIESAATLGIVSGAAEVTPSAGSPVLQTRFDAAEGSGKRCRA
jgi:hypothetical protein